MFEIGKRYTVWMGWADEVGSLDYKVSDYQAPLLKLHNAHVGADVIVNTASPHFVRAQLSEHQQDIDEPLDSRYFPGAPPTG